MPEKPLRGWDSLHPQGGPTSGVGLPVPEKFGAEDHKGQQEGDGVVRTTHHHQAVIGCSAHDDNLNQAPGWRGTLGD